MRFFEDGPLIPDLLLEKRDQGRVVFLCGAGISLNAGMPTFYELTRFVIDFFDPPSGSVIESEFKPWIEDYKSGESRPKIPLDQIFNLLYQEYGKDEVNALVAQRLSSALEVRRESLEHSILARISSDQEGNPQIVTTNFDHLFETGVNGFDWKTYVPPVFPDIELGLPLSGVTYLHGRIADLIKEKQSFVLSSADFGRAYLSEAWATNFIRTLLKNYTVVLIGYQAEDPPVKYLLQGLNHDELSDRSNLYAFDAGEPEDIEAKWRDRGVTSIACRDYPSLWKSLEAWATRAEDPRKWRADIIDMAKQGPRQLLAHQRGQVAHLVRTTPGARLFATTTPFLPAEWLCVFDVWCRVAKERRSVGNETEIFDPFFEYHLDDDPPRPSETTISTKLNHDNILEWRHGDTNPPSFHKLNGRHNRGFDSMPPRLSHLCNWITKSIESPIVAWWAARQHGLHPNLEKSLKNEVNRNEKLPSKARRVWSLILTHQSDERNFSGNYDWFEIKDRIKNEGWTPNIIQCLESVTAPMLSREPSFGISASKPPLGDWEDTNINEVANWKVVFAERHGEELAIPDEYLKDVFRIAEANLQRAVRLLECTNNHFFQAPTCYPDREIDGDWIEKHIGFEWLLKLFKRIVTHSPRYAQGFASTWPINEPFYFTKLKLFALNQVGLFNADESATTLLSLSQKFFWNNNLRRELLFLIRDRWDEFSNENRESITERLIDGPDHSEFYSHEEYRARRTEQACIYTKWLTLQGKRLNKDQFAELEKKCKSLPNWNDSWASTFTEAQHVSIRHLGRDETPDKIINLAVSRIVEEAKVEQGRDFEHFTEKRPFAGLVKKNPRKALSALSFKARLEEFPEDFWSTLIDEWPEDVNPRLFRVFLNRLARLPLSLIPKLKYAVGRWLQTKLILSLKFDESIGWTIFDNFVEGLVSGGEAITISSIGETRVRGEVVQSSRRTIEHALNSPIGSAMLGLHSYLDSLGLKQSQMIPDEIKSRIERLISTSGEGGDHAVAILTRQISWLYYLDPQWVKNYMIPWFDLEHVSSEPAWNGYLSAAKLPPEDIAILLKPQLLKLFPAIYTWEWSDNLKIVLSQIVIELAVYRSDKPYGLTAKEARQCLRNMKDQNRVSAISRLSAIGERTENGWNDLVIPFINNAWPKERKFRTSSLVRAWLSLIERSNDSFPALLFTLREYLVPTSLEIYWLYSFYKESDIRKSLTTRYPAEVLELLDAIVPKATDALPIHLSDVLSIIEETAPDLTEDRRFVRLINLVEAF